jgi:hypothetical protein
MERDSPPGDGNAPERRPARPAGRPSRRALWIWGSIAVLLIAIGLVLPHVDSFLRRTLEAKINQRLKGYTLALGGAHLDPLDLGLTLRDAVIRQQAHPEPPVVVLPRLKIGVEWRELLRFHLVAHALFDRPRIHADLGQLREENDDRIDMQDRGWQDALQAIYPLKLNRVEVLDGQVVYVDSDPERPLELTHWQLLAENIRNVRSEPGVYPSPVRSRAALFGNGRVVLTGHADFLSKPYPGIHALYRMEGVPLERLGVFSSRANLELHGGVLGSHGEVQWSPLRREAHVADLTVARLRLDYIHSAATAAGEKSRAATAARVAREDQPGTRTRIDRLHLTDGVLGFVDRTASPRPFRVFVDRTDLVVTRLSSGFRDGPAKAKLTGRFMGSGKARASATFREPRNSPDFDLDVAIEGAALASMNDLLRAHGKLDVTEGTFSVYSEVKIKDGRIHGYVKPLIEDVKVYDPQQDRKKPVLRKLYEKVAGGLSHLLENRPRDEVATVADLSGSIDDPDTSIWKIVVRLVSNAFVKAILPGFDRGFEAARHRR